MRGSVRKRCPPQWKIYAGVTRKSLKYISTTAEVYNLKILLIIGTFVNFSDHASNSWITSMIICLTGLCLNKNHLQQRKPEMLQNSYLLMLRICFFVCCWISLYSRDFTNFKVYLYRKLQPYLNAHLRRGRVIGEFRRRCKSYQSYLFFIRVNNPDIFIYVYKEIRLLLLRMYY